MLDALTNVDLKLSTQQKIIVGELIEAHSIGNFSIPKKNISDFGPKQKVSIERVVNEFYKEIESVKISAEKTESEEKGRVSQVGMHASSKLSEPSAPLAPKERKGKTIARL